MACKSSPSDCLFKLLWQTSCFQIHKLFHTADGGTIALDWLMNQNVMELGFQVNHEVREEDNNPIMIVVPGLTSDSKAAYIKHIVYKMAKRGWNVVVCNHRGLGGISITSDCFYNAGWTEDLRRVADHIHSQHPESPMFAVGTSIGANILVKYLGEYGVNVSIAGAAAICSPWDLLVKYLGEYGVNVSIAGAAAICSPWDLLLCDRFINRRLIQKFYDKVLTIGLKGYALLHSSSASFVGKVGIPLLCISAIDDPVCTSEAIPWDECKANENIVIASTQHGGHLAYFEGLTAKSVWWVRAIDEYFSILLSSPLIQKKKEVEALSPAVPLESSIDQTPYLNFTEDGLVTAVADESTINPDTVQKEQSLPSYEDDEDKQLGDDSKTREKASLTGDTVRPCGRERDSYSIIGPVSKCINQLLQQNRKTHTHRVKKG